MFEVVEAGNSITTAVIVGERGRRLKMRPSYEKEGRTREKESRGKKGKEQRRNNDRKKEEWKRNRGGREERTKKQTNERKVQRLREKKRDLPNLTYLNCLTHRTL